jgi:hypothetical protein
MTCVSGPTGDPGGPAGSEKAGMGRPDSRSALALAAARGRVVLLAGRGGSSNSGQTGTRSGSSLTLVKPALREALLGLQVVEPQCGALGYYAECRRVIVGQA